MKKLQSNFTTPEQSKRLLELGVPAWTADLYFYEEGCISNDDEPSGVIPYDEVYQDESKEGVFSDYAEFPCWSVGRLIEIHLKCCTTLNQNDAHIVISRFGIETGGLLQNMYDMVGECALLGKYDFSKLEE
ncbi:MAG: hypothetical protein E7075_00230 [Bacteroidales bacterium]|nr:hypothetical protein [Bacteroidales bacterium]